MGFKEENNKERMEFVEEWARFVSSHPDKEWSKQQNIIIDSAMRSGQMRFVDYKKMKS